MNILGIETSCDETAVAIVQDGKTVLINLIASSIAKHQKYGGIVPEIAARDQIKQIIPLIRTALQETGLNWGKIDKIAVTEKPGLISSLLVGINTAQTLAWLKQKPLLKIDHVKGHIYANWLEQQNKIQFPIMILTVSGGHNEMMLMHAHDNFELIGETLDDAAGEAFDKVAKMLGLGYPGGPVVSKLAEKGNPQAFKFPRSLNQNDNFNFSFSGLKTAVLYTLRDITKQALSSRQLKQSVQKYEQHALACCSQQTLSKQTKADLCASFQAAVCDSLSKKLVKAAEKYAVKEVHLAGGVSANFYLRQIVQERMNVSEALKNVPLRYPKKIAYCTDNAAMIAAAAFF